ncbi:MAG TPA: hypothetical protein VJ550_07130 [Geomonas sp.]|nr:hypothetical protein [Geomonas sp.]
MKAGKTVLVAAEYACIAGFLFTSYRADRAMTKAGIGNLDLFAFWSRCTWLVVTIFLLLWMLATVISLLDRQRKYFASPAEYWKHLLPDVLLPPVIFIVSWLAYMLSA